MSESPTKTELRAQLKQARLELTDGERTLKSQMIVAQLKAIIAWSSVHSLHYFEPMKQLGEPDTGSFITYLEDTYPDLQLCAPRLIDGRWQLIAARAHQVPAEFDVVIVPMLGFDSNLQRIGYGGGYYDTLLATQPKALKIGVCFDLGKLDQLPVEPHDIPLDIVVTESETHKA